MSLFEVVIGSGFKQKLVVVGHVVVSSFPLKRFVAVLVKKVSIMTDTEFSLGSPSNSRHYSQNFTTSKCIRKYDLVLQIIGMNLFVLGPDLAIEISEQFYRIAKKCEKIRQ